MHVLDIDVLFGPRQRSFWANLSAQHPNPYYAQPRVPLGLQWPQHAIADARAQFAYSAQQFAAAGKYLSNQPP